MCTNIMHTTTIEGMGKGAKGWFPVAQAYVSYDHPMNLAAEHAVGIDFVDRVTGLERVAVEITLDSARSLVAALQTALAKADEWESSD